MRVSRCILLSLLTLSLSSGYLLAEDKYSGTPAARAEFKKADIAKQSNNWAQAVADYKKAWEIDPNYAAAHREYMFASLMAAMGDVQTYVSGSPEEKAKRHKTVEDAEKRVTQQYEDLVKQHPDMPIYRWALAQRYIETDQELMEKHCKEALALDPNFPQAIGCVADVANLRGDTQTAIGLYRKMIALNPNEPSDWLTLQFYARNDPREFKDITDEIATKLAGTDTGALAVTLYAQTLPPVEEIAKLEEVVAKFPPDKVHGASQAADLLFRDYDYSEPTKAAPFAHKMLAEMPDNKGWKQTAEYADAMANAEAKVKTNDGKAALAILKNVKVPDFVYSTRRNLLTAEANDLSGQTATAYGDLLRVFAASPEVKLQTALYEYGKKLGKSGSAVDAEVWSARVASSTPAIPFTLESFVDGKNVSLSDYKGKVVLLDFWYPACGPCMGAMPFMEELYQKYKDSGLVFLGINGFEEQASLVMPLVKSHGWGFLPLKGSHKFCEDVYKVQGFPKTFLIGADGRVYFKPFTYDPHQRDIADMQIQALLTAAKQEQAK